MKCENKKCNKQVKPGNRSYCSMACYKASGNRDRLNYGFF
jgi:hypothetical protein